MSEGVSTANNKIILDRGEIREFRNKFPEYVNWEAEKYFRKTYFRFHLKHLDMGDFLSKYDKISPRLDVFFKKFVQHNMNQKSVISRIDNMDKKQNIFAGEYLDKYRLKPVKMEGQNISEYELNRLIRDLAMEDQKIRIEAVIKLKSIKSNKYNKTIITALLGVYLTTDEKVAGLADEALAFRFSYDITPLIEIASSDDAFNASKACELLGEMGLFASEAVPALKKAALNHAEWSVRIAAVNALSEIGPPGFDFRDELVKMLDDENYGIRQAAAKALLIISDSIPRDDEICDKIIESGLNKNNNMWYSEFKDKVCEGF